MRSIRFHILSAALVGALATQACAGGGTSMDTDSRTRNESTAELEALYRARTDSALMEFTEADAEFMTGMIGHHAQALMMAGLAPTNGASPSVGTLCARIINAQKDEIAWMQRWLRDRSRPAPEVHGAGADVTVHGPEHIMHMPGMLSREQMTELKEARGPEFDRVFLTYMIQHHQGAVTMVHDLFATAGAAQNDFVFKLASDIQVDQTTEIARMELMLESLPGDGSGR